jgi:hypothetical protein
MDRPAAVVLLDSDKPGRDARPGLENGYGDKQILNPDLILEIGDLKPSELAVAVTAIEEPEDLVPVRVALAGVARFAKDVLKRDDAALFVQKLSESFEVGSGRLFDALTAEVANASAGLTRPLTMGKVEFARAVSELVMSDPDAADYQELLDNFSVLFTRLNVLQAQATLESSRERLSLTVKRIADRFRRDHRQRSRRYDVSIMLEEIEQQVTDASPEAESVLKTIREIREEFKLGDDPLSDADDFPRLLTRLKSLQYIAVTEVEAAD